MRGFPTWFIIACWLIVTARAATLPLPPRTKSAPPASALLTKVAALPLTAREEVLVTEILAGNVPGFLRTLHPVKITTVGQNRTNTLVLQVTPDYLAVGSDADYCLVPLTPRSARRIADATRCVLPTSRMVDAIYEAADLKLAPCPIPPDAQMTTVAVFSNHNATVRAQRASELARHPPGSLIAGHKKDVVRSARLASAPGKVAIYGWHQTNGVPIQPLYLGHTADWVDYSHGVRLVLNEADLNGAKCRITEILADPELAGMISNEGVIEGAGGSAATGGETATGGQGDGAPAPASAGTAEAAGRWSTTNEFGERTCEFRWDPGVRVHLNLDAAELPDSGKPVTLVVYALPNGNTIEQTIGRRTVPGDDWHFNIQQVGAQMRFVRSALTNRAWVIAYLENDLKSWPAWRRKYGDARLTGLITEVKRRVAATRRQVVLTGHSGGGSFIFGYINTVQRIPPDVARIAFLDSNYAYDANLAHDRKLGAWLQSRSDARLCVFAYHDSIALLNGTNFVSAKGGTWGRSHAMLADLGAQFSLGSTTNNGLRVHATADRRVVFFLKENPEKKILHTTQVELNGVIHALLWGTAQEGVGYDYLGPRAYERFIAGP